MYGNYDFKLFLNSHVLLSSNMLVDTSVLSKDRWVIYKINQKLELVDITKKANKMFIEQEKQRQKQKNKYLSPGIGKTGFETS